MHDNYIREEIKAKKADNNLKELNNQHSLLEQENIFVI